MPSEFWPCAAFRHHAHSMGNGFILLLQKKQLKKGVRGGGGGGGADTGSKKLVDIERHRNERA